MKEAKSKALIVKEIVDYLENYETYEVLWKEIQADIEKKLKKKASESLKPKG